MLLSIWLVQIDHFALVIKCACMHDVLHGVSQIASSIYSWPYFVCNFMYIVYDFYLNPGFTIAGLPLSLHSFTVCVCATTVTHLYLCYVHVKKWSLYSKYVHCCTNFKRWNSDGHSQKGSLKSGTIIIYIELSSYHFMNTFIFVFRFLLSTSWWLAIMY